jgi:class 3 adenylate cyclase/predicted ATPase
MICLKCQAASQIGAIYCSQCGEQLPKTQAETPASAPSLHGERRQLTALFCDVVGSTNMAETLDPEEYNDVIRAFIDCCKQVIPGSEGHFAESRGDSVLFLFGYPASRGDEPERAIRAALDIVDAIRRLALPKDLQVRVRIGIATGLVAIDAGGLKEPAFAGEALNLAARLQSLADPNTVVISALTTRLAGGFFDLVDLGARDLKGFSRRIPAWRVAGIKKIMSRFEALRPELTSFVGRQNELQQIEKLWEEAKRGNGQVVTISGEAGIGKSRLINQVQATLCEERRIAKFSCSPYHTSTALYPVIEQISRMVRFRLEHSPDDRLEMLRKLMAHAGDDYERHVGWLAALLSLAKDVSAAVNAQEARQRTLEACLWWLTAVSKKRPLLIIVEDAHWIDPTSLQLAQMLGSQIGGMSALMIVSFRSPHPTGWVGNDAVVPISLDRLDRVFANAIIANVARNHALPPALVDQIIEKADGVPLFVEELTKTVLGSDAADHARNQPSGEPASQTQLPSTLQDSLTARLDQLAPAKRVAQIAAVVGREFPYDVLLETSGLQAEALESSLGQLLGAGLIHESSATAQHRFAFKHALVRDAAYESLLKRDRRALHAAVASTLERKNEGMSPVEPELLAHHFIEAGLPDEALKYLGIAARRGLQKSANVETLAHVSRALELLKTLPDTPEYRRQELELRVVAGWAYWSVKGFAAPEAEQTFLRAQELAVQLADDAMLMYALRGLYVAFYARGELRNGYVVAEQEIALAQKREDIGDLVLGRWALGSVSFWSGDFAAARRELEAALALYDPVHLQTKIFGSQVATHININLHLCWTLWILGFPDQALQAGERAVSDSRDMGHALSLSMALFWKGIVQMNRGELEPAAATAKELCTVTAEYQIAHLAVCGTILEGAVMIAGGDPKTGIQHIQKGLTEFRSQRAGLGVPWTMYLIANGCLRSGALKDAQMAAAMGLALTEKESERHSEAELHRIKGEILLASPDADKSQAEASLRQAIDVARRQKALSLELRAAMALSRLLRERGELERAEGYLAGVYSRFTEGFDTADLIEAKKLLSDMCETTVGRVPSQSGRRAGFVSASAVGNGSRIDKRR